MASQVLTGIAKRQGSSGFAAGTEIEAALLEGTIGQAATTEFYLLYLLMLFESFEKHSLN
jgi:hypothetical protein